MNVFLTTMPDGFAMLDKVNGAITTWAANLKLDAMIFYIVGIVLALGIGLFGYRLIKLLLSVSLAYVGYLAGVELFVVLETHISNMPGWLSYVCGGVCAVLLFVASFFRFSYALYTVLGAIGTYLIVFYTGGHWILGLGGGLLFALLTVFFVRISFVLISSFVGGIFCVSFLGKLLPEVAVLQLGTDAIAFYIALGVVVVLAVVQFLTTRRYTVRA